MFSTKQSDIFYNDETKEMFVCKVSAISAERCEDNTIVYGALPLVYKINKADNYKTLVYPKNLNTFTTDPNSDLYNLTPTCAVTGTNFDSITKPLINYNKTTSRYSVTFLGRYSNDTEGLGLNNYIFQDINSDFYLLDANIYIPKDKDITADVFTFENGYLNSDLYVVGNTIRNDKASWFAPSDNPEQERSNDYQVAPMYVQATSSLGFNLLLGNTDVTVDSLSGNVAFPFMYSGGFITYNPKYTAYDPEYTIRVDFTARSFNVPSPTAYASSQSVGNSATRWVQQYAPAGAGEGFCVSFFKNPPKNSYIIPNGVGSTLGYAKAGFSPNETAGTAHETDGLYVHNNWNPNTGIQVIKRNESGHFLSNINTSGYLGPAESFLGVGFDIGGNFATTTEDKDPGDGTSNWYNGNTTWTETACSIGIRGSSYHDTKVLTAFAMNTVAASAVPMHTSAANAEFVDYRIDLTNRGTKVTLYNKLTSATDYNTIAELRLNKIGGGDIGEYTPWFGMRSDQQITDKELPPLNIGLSFTTSDNVSRFELYKFEVTGVVIKNPWEEKKEVEEVTASVTKKIDYLQESSKNLRKKLLNVESDDLVDVEMAIPAKNIIANTINEETNKPQITMCDGTNLDIIEDDVDIKITGIAPEQVDKAIEVGESGYVPKIPGSTTTITHPRPTWDGHVVTAAAEKYVSNQDYAGGKIAAADEGQGEVFDAEYTPGASNLDRLEVKDGITYTIRSFINICYTGWSPGDAKFFLYRSNDITIKNKIFEGKTYNIYVRGVEDAPRGNINTITLLKQNIGSIEPKFLEEIRSQPDIRYWELKLFQPGNRRVKLIGYDEKYNEDVDSWSFEPLPAIDGDFNNVTQEKLHEILRTLEGEQKYFHDIDVCQPLPAGKEPPKHLDTIGEPYFASTTGGDSGAECTYVTKRELINWLKDVASSRGGVVDINTVFSIDEVTMEHPPGSKQIVNVVQLLHSGSSEPGDPDPIKGTGKCYYIPGGIISDIISLKGVPD